MEVDSGAPSSSPGHPSLDSSTASNEELEYALGIIPPSDSFETFLGNVVAAIIDPKDSEELVWCMFWSSP